MLEGIVIDLGTVKQGIQQPKGELSAVAWGAQGYDSVARITARTQTLAITLTLNTNPKSLGFRTMAVVEELSADESESPDNTTQVADGKAHEPNSNSNPYP